MPTIAEMTPNEYNFVLRCDAFLDHFVRPEERHVAMECLSVLALLQKQYPDVRRHCTRNAEMGVALLFTAVLSTLY